MKSIRINFLAFAAIAIFGFACGNSPEKTETSGANEETMNWELNFETVSAKEDGCTEEECTYVSLEIPTIASDAEAVAAKINEQVEGEIREMIKARLPEPMAMGTWESLAQSFIEGYRMFTMEFPDNSGKWYIDMNADESLFTADYFTLKLNISEYMGGAHPSFYSLLQSYDLRTGELVNLESILDMKALKREAEKQFRQKHELSEDALLDDGGFIFPEGKFVLPENMGITDKGILLIYNAYEVASYAEGQTEITIPLDAVNQRATAAN